MVIMNKHVVTMAVSTAVVSIILIAAPIKPAYAGTKIFGWDITSSYTTLRQRVLERVFGFSFPQNRTTTENRLSSNIDKVTEPTKPVPTPSNTDSFIKLTFTQKQVNDFIKSTVSGRNFGNGLTLKKGNVEFVEKNKINLTTEFTNSVKASASVLVIEDGTQLKIESLDIENAGLSVAILKPLVVKYFNSQQKDLVKQYAPADFAFIEVRAGQVNVYMKKEVIN